MATPTDKEQYRSLLNETHSNSSELDTLHPRVKLRVCHSSIPYIPAILSLLLGITLATICSTNLGRLDALLQQVQAQPQPLATTAPPTPGGKTNPTGAEFGHCGNSIKEARSLGCIFDPMSWAWQRPECYNARLVDDFLTSYEWHFYPNNQTRSAEELPEEKWKRGDYLGAWGSWSWHMYHCSYSWRKFHAAFQSQKPLDDDVLDPEHTVHCSTAILLRDTDPKLHAPCEEDPGGCQVTQMWVRFNKCGYY
ncbi:hypothetical protein BDV27DRAFT_158527 [Aspergillus caelatus]|uniref:Uncharacterized protein n=1 Tax=Aspergillus caelatus TaxID=61420 RepID=A0A5N7A2U6_9EURO|nr:uncharacterized protein BDV27DRAFT_158527 [Aspergillus caelatus]KAE8363748.1 hypothetical protein BDV27DRAFT_158527 [Aspergillus caelatus]